MVRKSRAGSSPKRGVWELPERGQALALILLTLLLPASCALVPTAPSPTALPSAAPTATSRPTLPEPTATLPPVDPFALISQESLFAYLEDLTNIQPYSGWRNSASAGEAEALDYVAAKLADMEYLQERGLEIERQSFPVFLGTELWQTRLHLTVDGQEVEVPADGLRGPRDDIPQALHFDSDGGLNDAERNPVVVEGAAVLLPADDVLDAISTADLKDKVVFLDYAAVDWTLMNTRSPKAILSYVLSDQPAGLVLVTQYSSQAGESHGSFVGDENALNLVETDRLPPTLYVRLEDLAPAGIARWEDLTRIENARLTWDADVFSPAASGNLIARIPAAGNESADQPPANLPPADLPAAMILGAHIDSPNSPGALDDGSGSVALLEVARVLDEARVQPEVDLYLVWFGSEEIGLYGSFHFAATHQELLDRTLAMLQIDCLTRPMDGIDAYFSLVTWSYGRLGDDRLPWPETLAQAAGRQGVWAYPNNFYGVGSDNTAFAGFDVPNVNLVYVNYAEMERIGGAYYAGYIHSPYDRLELAQEVGDALEQIARVALTAALQAEPDVSALRVTPQSDRRALFVGSHTESVHMAPTAFTELGMALAWEGFDVDMIPYGQAVTPADLENTDLVIVLPVVDYPSPQGDTFLYDTAWNEEELTALEAYVTAGGLLVLTNSHHRLKYENRVLDRNEDWSEVNRLASRFGITYYEGTFGIRARVWEDHPLVQGLTDLEMISGNGVRMNLAGGQILAEAGPWPVVALLDHGRNGGQVLALADVGILGSDGGEPVNLAFWIDLARYARTREE